MPMYVKRWILVIAGVLAGHQLAHSFAHSHAADAAHGYLSVATLFVFPAAVAVLLNLVWVEALRGTRQIRVADLLVAQVIVFVLQESTERIVVGLSPLGLLLDPVLWLGVAAQMLVAGLFLTFVTAARQVLTRVATAGRPFISLHRLPARMIETSASLSSAVIASLPPARAPPVVA